MTTKDTLRQLVADSRLDEAIDEFNRRYLPSTRLVSHQQREEAKKCLMDLLNIDHPVTTLSLNPPAISNNDSPVLENQTQSDPTSQVKKLQEKIKKLEVRKEEIRAFGMKCFNETEEMKQRLAILEEERDKLVNENKILETHCDKYSQQARYHQSNSQILENKCKMLQREFELVKSRLQGNSYSYSSQSSEHQEDYDYRGESQISPDIIADSMEDSDSENSSYPDLNSNNAFQVVNPKTRYPNIELDLVPKTYNGSRSSGPIRAPARFTEQRMLQRTKPVRQQSKPRSGTTNNVTRERSSTTINDLVLAKYLSEGEQVRAFSGKNGCFYGVIVMNEKQQYGIMDQSTPDQTVYTNPSSWVKRDIVLQHVQKNTSIVRGSQYSGWECVKVVRNCSKSGAEKWTKLAVIRKTYDSAIETSFRQSNQNYTFYTSGR